MGKCGWVYILHFDTKLKHAAHYVGSSAAIAQRMQSHRDGRGARLTQVLLENAIGWTVATVLQCELVDRRKLERTLKRQKNARRYCPLCTPRPRRLPGCIPIPTEPFQ